ncbi:MAG: undecaprenyldiphospho-muramoylpentapeptide beta-N-acetylglucosaminyltransferase [Selenomonadaceae bacterium]|nr:undecaprenyldiphospho-muramoylpentapeptide beta-N-acetylglucosaminyltransferase [Selenomonadaceae bacterium]
MKIIVSGGGTGGHIYPAITLINTLREMAPEASFLYVGTPRGLEADIVPKEGLPFATIDLQGLERRFTLKNFFRLGRAALGVAKAAGIVNAFLPDVVIGTGGYVCGPVLLAASLRQIPTLIQEQNVVPGITNRILARFVTKVAVGTEGAVGKFPAQKTVFTGNPIRPAIMAAKKSDGLKEYGFDPAQKIVLVSGGSRGAHTINQAMVDFLAAAAKENNLGAQYLHVTGKNEYDWVMSQLKAKGVNPENLPHIRIKPYLYDMPLALAMADLAVFRAGATGLSELTARGIPAILVPYPYASENHQELNARALEKAGAARVILNRELTGKTLGELLGELLPSEDALQKMATASRALGRPEAAKAIAELALSIARK